MVGGKPWCCRQRVMRGLRGGTFRTFHFRLAPRRTFMQVIRIESQTLFFSGGGAMKRLALLMVCTFVLGMALTALNGCGGGGGANEALIGANLELSGSEGSWGQDSQRGIELARDEINAKPGQKIKLAFKFEDDKSDP